ncbi:MAG TPA: sulfatase [Thermoleophilaceae bacterium]
MTSTRRQFLRAGASAAVAGSLLDPPLSRAAARERPNVLVIVIDTLREDHAFGDRARTPNIDALTREGLRFTHAFPSAMPTVPVRNAILSGRRGFPFRGWHDHRGLLDSPGWEPVRDVDATFTSALHRAGYWTGYVTDNPFLGFSYPYRRLRRSFDLFVRRGGEIGGTDKGVSSRELHHWLHPAIADAHNADRLRRYIANGHYDHDDSQSFAARVFTSGAAALRRARRHQPFALIVDTYEPHEPWTPPQSYIDMYGSRDWRGPELGTLRYGKVHNWLRRSQREAVLDRLRAIYAAEVTMTDRWLGVLLERLHDLRLERETVIVLVADHGIFLGERGWTGKISVALHPELTHVPLVVIDPERRLAGRESDFYASPHDVGRTILSMTGVRPPAGMEGADLSAPFRGKRLPKRPFAYGGYRNSHYLRDGRWAFFADNRMKQPHLYDLRTDSIEGNDVASRHPHLVRELHERVVEQAGGRLPYYRL